MILWEIRLLEPNRNINSKKSVIKIDYGELKNEQNGQILYTQVITRN